MWLLDDARACNHLKVHPMKCTPEQVSKIIVEMCDKTFRGEQPPKGLSYYSQREAWRGYFQIIRGVPGQIMSDLGVRARFATTSKSCRHSALFLRPPTM